MELTKPKLFISYSHDSEEHKAWVLKLATRLEQNGVHVILDQWDITLGSDLTLFMEQGLTSADRVLVICTEPYVAKANMQKSGGVGYEKMIISSQIMRELNSNRVIPVIVNNSLSEPVPTFVGARLRLSFDAVDYENSYVELIHDLHGEKMKPRPAVGPSPFNRKPPPINPVNLSQPDGANQSPTSTGKVTFVPNGNYDSYWVGSGEMLFETKWGVGGRNQAYIYKRQPSLHSLVFAKGITDFNQITDANSEAFFKSEDTESLEVGDIAVIQNINGYYLAVKLESSLYRSRDADDRNEITFSYAIAPAKSTSFAGIV